MPSLRGVIDAAATPMLPDALLLYDADAAA